MTELRRQNDRARLQASRWILPVGQPATRRTRWRPVRGVDGKGDEVRAVADAARTHGFKLGVYLSPADLYQLRTNPKNPGGYYGDGSSNVLSVIPTDPASFKSDPSKGRTPAPGFGNYTYVVDDYNRYFLNQLYELLTQYGPIEEVWFDGANPDPSVHETYNYNAWYDLIRHLQPKAVIMGKGPDVRWVGNEGGVGRTTEWSVIPLPTSPDDVPLAGHDGVAISAAAPNSCPVRISGGIRRKSTSPFSPTARGFGRRRNIPGACRSWWTFITGPSAATEISS